MKKGMGMVLWIRKTAFVNDRNDGTGRLSD